MFTLQLAFYLPAVHSTFASQCCNTHAELDQTAVSYAAVVLADAATSALTQPVLRPPVYSASQLSCRAAFWASTTGNDTLSNAVLTH